LTIYASSPCFSEDSLNQILSDLRGVLTSGRLTDGPHVHDFEEKFAKYNGSKYAVAVSCCSAALEISLRHFNLKGREVIVPTNTFVATANAVIFAGGKPVFADMNPDTLGADVEDIKRKVTANTAGVIVVHLAGLVCPQIRELQDFCHQKGLFLVEDCAHAHGATMNGQKAGAFGDSGCFSFYPTKVMTTCEGGMLTTDNEELSQTARCLRTYGQDANRLMVTLGFNWRLNEMAAVIGKHQLEHLDEFIERRNQIAHWYQEAIGNVAGVSVFRVPAGFRHSYYKYPVRLADGIDRIKVASTLKDKFGVESGHVYYPPVHLHPYYRETFGTKEGDQPNAERVLPQVLCLPMHYGITKENVAYIRDALEVSINQNPPKA
jgi:dTDP-4-amino-4,6-dideoxygalactose transaminase